MAYNKQHHLHVKLLLCFLMILLLSISVTWAQDEGGDPVSPDPIVSEEPTDAPPPVEEPPAEEPTDAPPPVEEPPAEEPTDAPPPAEEPPAEEPTDAPPPVEEPPAEEPPVEEPTDAPPPEEPPAENPESFSSFSIESVSDPSDSGVDPVFVDDNPSCEDLGYDFEYKVDPPNSGAYVVLPGLTINVTNDGTYVSWSANFGIDAVIVKGGPNANLYVYDPPAESFGDSGLHSPINASNGTPYGVSHISFCYDLEVLVEKTAATTYTRTWEWDIDKSVTPESWDLFTGDSGTSDYTVTITKTGYTDSNWAVTGTITIYNPAPVAATITGVSDNISGVGGAAVDCGVSFPYNLDALQSLVCSYSSALPDGTQRLNTATATTSGSVGGGSGTADITFGDPSTVVNDSVSVTDTYNGDLGSFSETGSTSYSRTFACDGDEGSHGNTATIVETGQSDSANVDVNCYSLEVTKDAAAELTRSWTWTIEKIGDQTELLLAVGQSFAVNYEVHIDATSVDSNWMVDGGIYVYNPAPITAVINTVADVISPAIAAAVDCGGDVFPYYLGAGETLICAYSASVPDASDRLNTATATLQNFDYDSAQTGSPVGTTDFSGTANVSFAGASVVEVDECIAVTDDHFGFLGTICADTLPVTFIYVLYVGPYDACGTYEFINIASFVTVDDDNDTGATGSDDHTVVVNVPCPSCTLTQGYWKTHSEHGPAPYDDTWALLPNGADTMFFGTGMTWYEMFWTPPTGNPYIQLAHQYMAAKLNELNGSDVSAISQTLIDAQALLSAYTPATLPTNKRAQARNLATILDNYNNGLIGPGHCDE